MVHQYKLNGYNIVLDTCSGSVHVVDDVAYDIIALYQQHEAEEIVKEILSKYDGLPDITREEVLLCLEDIRAPVSYTHLDVYKRQDENRKEACGEKDCRQKDGRD